MAEDQALALLAAGDTRGATTWVLRAYGAEVCGYVLSLLKNEDDAADAFARATEILFTKLATFRGASSLRTWFYGIARHVAFSERRRERRARKTAISDLEEVLTAAVRTATLEYQKSGVKGTLAALRDSLSSEDRELLVLRVDRNLSWPEVAAVLLGDADGRTDDDLKREAARARKQFERAKARLRERLREAGLLD